MRPQIRAWRKPRQVIITDGRARGRWPREDNTWVSVVPSLRACGARPSEGGLAQDAWPCGGRPGDGARGVFLGGMRSARPGGKAELAPRHFISTTCVDDDPVAKRRQRWSWRCAVVAGVRSPPLRGVGKPGSDGLTGRTRRSRERRFSRRDALCASAWGGRTRAEG